MRSATVVALVVLFAASSAPAQSTGSSVGTPSTGSAVATPSTGTTVGTKFFPSVPVRAPIVFYPTLTITGVYDDNVFLDNNRRESDYIIAVTPAARLILESTTYRWTAGYSFTAEKYFDHSELSSPFQRQHFFIEGSHRVHPRFTLTLSEVFVESKDTNLLADQGVSIGRQTSRSNVFSPGFRWQFAPRTSLTAGVSYQLQRFDGTAAVDSDEYRVSFDIHHDFTSRFTGSIGYEGRYIDVQGQAGTITHTPRLGVIYRFTPSLTATVRAGPTLIVTRDETTLSSFVDARLAQVFGWGSASVYVDRSVGTASGLGSTTENTSFGAVVQATLRRFELELAPRYTITESVGSNAVDVHSLTVDLRVAYRLTDWLAAVGGYHFFQQTSESTGSTLARDIDQNRAFLGMQFGWPFRL